MAALVAYLAVTEVAAVSANTGLKPGPLDVHAAATNNLMYVGYLLLTAFVYVMGDSLVSDRLSGYGRLVLARGIQRASRWRATMISAVVAAAFVQVVLLLWCTVIGVIWTREAPVAPPSDLASAPLATRGLALFPPIGTGANMLLRQLSVAGYLTLAFSAICLLLVAATLKTRQPAAVVTCAILGLIADYVLAKAWDGWLIFSPGVRLLEGVHHNPAVRQNIPAWSGVAYFALILAASYLMGRRQFGSADL
ncbi:MAG TPA: hypothetical protein VLA05_05330 [Coriobacteriia bacterium]|nr:hypothetical protein [Coriobacteriia bacterium]